MNDATLRRLVREHVSAWRAYFAETGGEPAQMWATFAALERALDEAGPGGDAAIDWEEWATRAGPRGGGVGILPIVRNEPRRSEASTPRCTDPREPGEEP